MSATRYGATQRGVSPATIIYPADAYDVVVRSPGAATDAGDPVRGGTRRAVTWQSKSFANCRGRRSASPAQGKSTTVSLIAVILRAGGLTLIWPATSARLRFGLLDTVEARSFVVLELSSYQLDGARRSPHVAVLLNIVPEHLTFTAD
jgi:UDP-N-acetylmuramoylalanine--D-glutamate ligase